MPTIAEIGTMLEDHFLSEKASDTDAVIQFDLSGDGGGLLYVVIKDGTLKAHEGPAESPAMTLKATKDDYYAIMTGDLNAMQAFMQGKVKVSGDMGLAMKIQTMFSQPE
jgi:putative sterol carrier protein